MRVWNRNLEWNKYIEQEHANADISGVSGGDR